MSLHATRARPPAVAAGDDEDWAVRGTCRTDPDAWSGFDGRGKADIARAAHLCGHCPVQTRCHAEAQRIQPQLRKGVVYAGLYYDLRTGTPIGEDQPEETTCPTCDPAPVRVCAREVCAASFTVNSRGWTRKYCSDRCQRWDAAVRALDLPDTAVCEWCEESYPPRTTNQAYCCSGCRHAANNAKRYPPRTALGGLKISDLERAGVWP